MGQRYCSILNFLKKEFSVLDIDNLEYRDDLIAKAEKFIIATPTDTHYYWCKLLSEENKPVLCEKPLTKNIEDLEDILESYTPENLFMVNNYHYLIRDNLKMGLNTEWNFYKSGNDGFAWDCIQMFMESKGKVYLKRDSPLWRCFINGKEINYKDIDKSYIFMLKDFCENNSKKMNFDKTFRIHVLCEKLERERGTKDSVYWRPSEDDQRQIAGESFRKNRKVDDARPCDEVSG